MAFFLCILAHNYEVVYIDEGGIIEQWKKREWTGKGESFYVQHHYKWVFGMVVLYKIILEYEISCESNKTKYPLPSSVLSW